MNEVHQIHLGRQAYTIAADAYKELHDYLDAIKKKVGKEVAEEVELRMSELLTERGITSEKVVLKQDVHYLKEQLGTPGDFGDDEEVDDTDGEENVDGQKRLFRDTDNAVLAGVAAGLAKYLGIDVIIIRLVFIGLTFFGASGVLLYIILWLLVPAAKTNSDRLQMNGLAVTVDNIKGAVERADVSGATRRATQAVGRVVAGIAKIVLMAVGVVLVAAGVGVLLAALCALVYGLIHGLQIGDGTRLFPTSSEEVAVLACGVVVVGLVAILLATSGITMLRRRHVMPAWAIAAIVGVFIAAGGVGTALGFDVAPTVKNHYQALQYSRHVVIQPFTRLSFVGSNVFYISQPGPTSDVEIRTLGKIDTSAIKVVEKDGVLTVDTSKYHPHSGCSLVCPFGMSNTEVVIQTPDIRSAVTDGTSGVDPKYGTGGPFQPTYNL